ncbi:translation initiation factor eIF-1A [Candidatus Pacearchaeota archaeon]|nr:translation initiation factor eIF-1A [Candidatus Pacearchaeota archaeon]
MPEEFEDTEEQGEVENAEGEQQFVSRAPLPKGEEVIGVIEQRLGGNKMMVNCLDGKNRNCRVPGRLKRKLWLRPGDVVIVEPWELDKNKGDVILKYKPNQIEWLKKKGYLKTETSEF